MILAVQEIHKSYGKQRVLNNISFTIEEPQIVALVGPNGSGKSTLLNIITNLVEADEGQVTILNESNQNTQIFKNVSYMQDNSVLYDYLTGYDHLQFIANVQGLSKAQIIKTAERVGMDSYLNKRVGKYSLGMKQHLLLTMAILNEPEFLILDEPLNGLDPTSAIRVRNLLVELYEEGTTILLSSHNLSEIDRVTSNILFLKDGQLIKEDLTELKKINYEFFVDNPAQVTELLLNLDETVIETGDDFVSFHLKEVSLNDIVFELMKQNIELLDIQKKVIGSEDRYQEIFNKKDVSQ